MIDTLTDLFDALGNAATAFSGRSGRLRGKSGGVIRDMPPLPKPPVIAGSVLRREKMAPESAK